MYCLNCNKKYDSIIKCCPNCSIDLIEDHDFSDVIKIIYQFKNGYDPLLDEEFDKNEIYDDDNVQEILKKILNIDNSNSVDLSKKIINQNIIRRDISNNLNRDTDKIYLDLVVWRRKYSEEHDIKPYMIFSNQDLYNIANGDVCNKEDLLEIKGIKEIKYNKFADDLMQVLKPYINENDVVYNKVKIKNKIASKKDLPNAYKPWTENDDEILKEMITKEKTLKEIAEAFGRSEDGVVARTVRAGIFKNRDEARECFKNIRKKRKYKEN